MVRPPCDQCNRRKVRCDCDNPCRRCRESDITCTYTLVRKKRGPKAGKGKIIESLRSRASAFTPSLVADGGGSPEHRRSISQSHALSEPVSQYVPQLQSEPYNVNQTDDSAQMPMPTSYFTFDEFTSHILADDLNQYGMPNSPIDLSGFPAGTPIMPALTPVHTSVYSMPPTALQTPAGRGDDLESTAPISRAIELFFLHLYPIYPLVDRETLENNLANFDTIPYANKTLLWSLCALTLAHVDSWPSLGTEQRAVGARKFIRLCFDIRLDWTIEKACFADVLTSLFIGLTFFELKFRTTSNFYVREAITLSNAAGLTSPQTYTTLSEEDGIKYKRAYALLYITERGAAMHNNFPVTILAPPDLPTAVLPSEDPSISIGLAALHSLFSLLDFKFVRIWNDPTAFSDTGYVDLSSLQSHLSKMEFQTSELSDIQKADILITHQYFRLIFWQAALRQGFISTNAANAAFSYNFPADIAIALCAVVKSVPPVAIQVHGIGIFEKQFEVAYSLMDTLALSSSTRPEHHECLRYLLLSLSASPNSRQIFVRTLEKAIDGQQKYRNLAGVQLLRDDSKSRQASRRQSISFHHPG
ncbi:Hypothetical protein R9X50_00152400 [Acrodontium crateriforme]|uniref:Zn(2)-C6 fungal-type domain-containing protein n=1 Tax=Acrodontium crateriforme TaxID=150365 RepID=A0AAQ3R2V9_9PEZI|nr:Hypothetical protein R9X50_00152400 [Acrodontium crateriforme]